MKKLSIIALVILFISCKEKSVKEQSTISLDNFNEFAEDVSIFQKAQFQSIKTYNDSKTSNQKLVLLNYPFKSSANFDVLVYWDDILVYQKSKGKLIEFQQKNSFTHIRVYIINDSKVYRFDTKGGFKFDKNNSFFYLIFCPTNDEDYMFNIIPSNSALE